MENKDTIITVSRQFGSGGRTIARKIAENFSMSYYDKKLISLVSEQSGFSEDMLEKAEEKASNSLLYSLSMGLGGGGYGTESLSLNEQFYLAQFKTIRQIGEKGGAVIVGRCADYILRERPNCIHIFICADEELRIRRAVEDYGVSEDEARARLAKIDKARANYYKFYTSQRWGDAKNYHLSVDSGLLGLDASFEIVKNFLIACGLTPKK